MNLFPALYTLFVFKNVNLRFLEEIEPMQVFWLPDKVSIWL